MLAFTVGGEQAGFAKKGGDLMTHVYCPDCDGRIVINPHAVLGMKLTCPHCDAELEVIGTDPVEIDWVYDWEWDDDEEEDDDEDW
jgi:hypothetical protein